MKPKSILRFSTFAAASLAASANALTYHWIGTTSDFDEPSNWVENAWTQWGDYRFGSTAVSGAVNLDAFFGGGNWYLDSGLAHDVTLTGSQPLVAYANSGNGGYIQIDTASRDLTIQTGVLSAGAVTWNVGADRTLTMEGQLSDWFNTAALIKQGSGIAVLKSASGYTGGTTLSGGTLRLENISALGGGLSMASGTTLQLRSDTDATFVGGNGLGGLGNASITIDVSQLTNGNTNKTLSFATSGFNTYNTAINATGGNGYSLALGGINNGFGGSLNLTADTAGLSLGYIGTSSPAASLTVGGASNTTVTGAVNTGSLTKNDAGTLTLSGTLTNTGSTTIAGGILSLSSATLDDGAAVVIDSGAVLNLNFGGSDTVGSLSIDGSLPLPAGTYNSTTHPSHITGTGSLVVLAQDGTWTSLANGNWSDAANWAGNILASGIDNTATFNAATGVIVTLDTNRTIGNLAFDISDYTLVGSSTLTLETSSVTPGIAVTTGRTATISTTLGGVYGLEKTGAGTLILTAPNTFSGETVVSNGLLQLGASPASNPQFGALENSYQLTISSGATVRAMGANAFKGWSGGTMDVSLNGGTLTINDGLTEGGNHNLGFVILNGGTISGVGNATFGGFNLSGSVEVTENSTISATNTNTNGGTRTITVSDGKTLAWSGTIANGYLNAASTFVFEGTGTTVLSGINTYTGNTTINSGSLVLADDAQLKFAVTDSSQNIVGGVGNATFNGDFNIDTSGVSGTTGGIWLLVDRANLTGESFGSTFNVIGFTQQVDGVTWTMTDAKGDWSFSEDTGELTLDVGSDYDTWKTANGVTGAEGDDDDNDGLTNFEEYAFGLDPTGGSSVNPITTPLDKTTGGFSYTRRATSLPDPALTYTVWYSTNLSTWTEDTGATEGTPVLNGEVETVPITLSPALLANSKLFIQVRAN